MSLIDFYRKLIRSVGLYADEEGFVYSSKSDSKVLLTIGGKPLVLPTKEHIESIYDTNEDGEYVISKLPYNPLNEDCIKGDSTSLKSTKLYIEKRLCFLVHCIGRVLLTVASDVKLQKKVSLEVKRFLANINEGQSSAIKQLIDEKVLSNWDTIGKECIRKSELMFEIYIKKSGVHDGVKYHRLTTLSSSLYETLKTMKKDESICGIKLRNKDIIIYKTILEFIVEQLAEEDGLIVAGSNDNDSPAIISLLSVYLPILNRCNSILATLKDIDPITYETCYIEDPIAEKELLTLSKYKKELINIPSETDLSRMLESKKKKEQEQIFNRQPTMPTAYPTTPVNLADVKQQPVEVDPVMRSLYGGHANPTSVVVLPQQPQMYQQPIMQQPMVQQPMMQPMNNMYNMQVPNISNPSSYYQPQQVYNQPTTYNQVPGGIGLHPGHWN